MARYEGDGRYVAIDDYSITRPALDADQVRQITDVLAASPVGEVELDEVTANQDNFPLPLSLIVIFSTDASRNFTGFTPPRPGILVFCNGGSNDGAIVNNSGSSDAENRVLTHTGANITLNSGESVFLFYHYGSSRWRTIGFA